MIKELLLCAYLVAPTSALQRPHINEINNNDISIVNDNTSFIFGGYEKTIYKQSYYINSTLDYFKSVKEINYYSLTIDGIFIEHEYYLDWANYDDQVSITSYDYYDLTQYNFDYSIANIDELYIDVSTEYCDFYSYNQEVIFEIEETYVLYLRDNNENETIFDFTHTYYVEFQGEQGFDYRGNGVLTENYQDNYGYLSVMGFPILTQEAYLSGLDDGEDIGYQKGYSEGFSSNNNLFSLIGNAFNGLANFFRIEIIPGISLGLLIFAPLFIGVVLVLLKLVVK